MAQKKDFSLQKNTGPSRTRTSVLSPLPYEYSIFAKLADWLLQFQLFEHIYN